MSILCLQTEYFTHVKEISRLILIPGSRLYLSGYGVLTGESLLMTDYYATLAVELRARRRRRRYRYRYRYRALRGVL